MVTACVRRPGHTPLPSRFLARPRPPASPQNAPPALLLGRPFRLAGYPRGLGAPADTVQSIPPPGCCA